MHTANLVILVVCQLISATGSIVMVTLGGIIGTGLAPSAAWSTLPVSMMVIAVAATTIPATLLMRRIGRSRGFAVASLSAASALAIAVVALAASSFLLFLLAAATFGVNMAFTQQYRYAAAESVTPEYVPRAVSFVLLGSIGGAFVGPWLVIHGQHWLDSVPYAGTLLAVGLLYLVQALLLLRLRGMRQHDSGAPGDTGRPLGVIARQPVFIVAVLGGVAGYGLMTLIMTATPISMHVHDGFSLEQTAEVIKMHVLGMYVPSLVSGFLIERFGVHRLMFAGALLLFVTTVIGLQGQSLLHYGWALVLLGVGWNFLYVGGTTMLTYTYTIAERFRAQAINEFLVFGTSATASLLAGTILHYAGWLPLMLIPMPVLLAICAALIAIRRHPLLAGQANAG